jgi:hypothetical protein
MMQDHLQLDDILTRDVAVQWFEGVAVVQAAWRRVDAASASGFPSPSEIAVGRDGSISLLGASNGNAVPAAAHLLAQMLSDDVPVRLRLLVSQATGTDTAFATLADFSEALAYFERPDPQSLIRGLFERAQLRASRPVQQPPRETQPRTREEDRPAPPHKGARPGKAVLAAVAAAVACAAVWLAGASTGSASVTAALDTLKAAVGSSVGDVSAASDDTPAPRTRTTPAGRPAAGARHAARSRATGTAAAGRSEVPTIEMSKPDSLAGILVPFPFLDATPLPVRSTFESSPEVRVVIASSVRDRFGNELGAGRLYTSHDTAVTPPRHVYPKLADDASGAAGDFGGRTVLELVVATDGRVEHVKLRTAPRDIHEFMLVAAAKAWRFTPATLDGRPVRFLHNMPITTP